MIEITFWMVFTEILFDFKCFHNFGVYKTNNIFPAKESSLWCSQKFGQNLVHLIGPPCQQILKVKNLSFKLEKLLTFQWLNLASSSWDTYVDCIIETLEYRARTRAFLEADCEQVQVNKGAKLFYPKWFAGPIQSYW